MAGALLHGDGSKAKRRWFILIVLFTIIAALLSGGYHYKTNYYGQLAFPTPHGYAKDLTVKEFVKPDNVKIIGLVFFGRRNRVEMLRCFLERNLVDNGGWLDEVHWVQNTGNKADLEYLDEILATTPRYKKIDLSSEGVGFVGYGFAWGHLERGNLYVKIDDDVVWFADDVIPRLTTMKLANPQYLLVSANVINSPLMGWVHYHMGAVHPYLPEFDVFEPPSPSLSDLTSFKTKKPWRYTEYPEWTGPSDWYFDLYQDPPYPGHRWLRLQNDSEIHRTPIADIQYDTWGTGLKSWSIAAQEHYSFLENLAENRLDRYKFGKPWITDYRRLSINFITLWADDVLDNLPMDTVDEEWLTINLPKKLGRSVAVESDALAVHFTFGTQGKVEQTDLLPRYHAYAKENACMRRVS